MAQAEHQPLLPVSPGEADCTNDSSASAGCASKYEMPFESGAHAVPVQLEEPIHVDPDHILDHVENYFKPGSMIQEEPLANDFPCSPSSKTIPRIPLYANVQITNAKNVDTSAETFDMKIRLYLMWEVDLCRREDPPTKTTAWRQKASESRTGYCALSEEDIARFFELVLVPSVGFANSVAKEAADTPGVRVYRRTTASGLDTVMLNQAYHMTFAQGFDLRKLPFDTHALQLQLELDNAQTWNTYHLTVCTLVLHRDVKQVSQFDLLAPKIKLETSASICHRRKTILIPVARQWMYYFHTVVCVFVLLSCFAQLTFCCGVEEVGDRLAFVVTLFLTVVAFKFTLDLPKLSYVTTLDNYMLQMMSNLFITGIFSVIAKKMIDLRTHGILPQFDESALYWLDFSMAVLNGLISASIHLIFLMRALWYNHNQRLIPYIDGRNFMVYHFAQPFFLPKYVR